MLRGILFVVLVVVPVAALALECPCPDADGDGVCDAADNCPAVANPDQTIRLSADSVSGANGAYPPTGAGTLYNAAQETGGFELYAACGGGGTAVKLNGSLVAGGNVTSFGALITPDGSRVVYHADQDTDEVYELYSAPIEGGLPVKLNGALATSGDVLTGYQMDPTGSIVVYVADQDVDDVYELYSVPITGGTPVKLHPSLSPSGDISTTTAYPPVPLSYQGITADGSRVVYRADQDSDDVIELYSVPIAGGPTVKLSPPPGPGGDVGHFVLSQDGAYVVFTGDFESDAVYGAYAVPVTGGEVVKLNTSLSWVTTEALAVTDVAPDGPRAVFVTSTGGMYSARLAGGPPVLLAGTVNGARPEQPIVVTPDGDTVVFHRGGVLHGVSILGGASWQISNLGSCIPCYRCGGAHVGWGEISSDSSMVIYRRTVAGLPCSQTALFSSAIEAPNEVQLSPNPVPGWWLAPNDAVVAFLSSPMEIAVVPTTGGMTTTIPTDALSSSYILDITPDGMRVQYYSDALTPFVRELFSSPLAGLDAAGDDEDGDGSGGACDCRPTESDLWSAPGDATSLRLPDRAQLTWQGPSASGGTVANRYDVLRSPMPDDFASGVVVCVESDDAADSVASDPATPLHGGSFFYLVRAENDCGPGGLGSGSDGIPRAGRDCP
jgi:Tol biopolymer transport system component